MFDDVYAEIPQHLERQRDEMREHIAKYPEHYIVTDRAKHHPGNKL